MLASYVNYLVGYRFRVLAVFVGVTVWWIWMIVDVATKERKDKMFWLLVVILLFWIGALLYYLIRKQKRA